MDKQKLIIHNIDGTTTEVEPVKMWSPTIKRCTNCHAIMNYTAADNGQHYCKKCELHKGE